MTGRKPDPRQNEEEERSAEARRILRGVSRDSETLGASSLARVADRARDHLAGADNSDDDRIEIWGKRIGRGLGLLAVIGLALHLVFTYLLR